jgi:long-subunit acyl-CoA synthetase (AMP-forming)
MKFFKILTNHKINYFWATPSLIDFLNKLNCDKNLINKVKSNLNMIFVGTAPFSKKLNNDFYKKLKVKCLESYGSTEQLLISSNSINFKIYKSGKILPNVKCKLNNENEMIINSKFTFDGYLKKYDEIEMRKSKIFETGDLAKINKHNYLEIIGRKKNIIIKNGINYSPKYYEEKIENFRSVNRVIVLGISDKTLNQKIYAVIEKKNKINLKLFTKKIKTLYKEIDEVIFLNKIPLTKIGKPDINHLNKIIKKL